MDARQGRRPRFGAGWRRGVLLACAVSLFCVALAVPGFAAAGERAAADRALDHALKDLVRLPDGPPGAIAVIQRGDERDVHTAGVANVKTDAPLGARKHMRIASVAKAFSGAVALALVDQGVLSLDDTIGELLPDLPLTWHPMTLRQLLQHTSGMPDYTQAPGFADALAASPAVAPTPGELLAYAASEPLNHTPPGSAYEYSNSENIAVGMMVETVTGASYEDAIRAKVTTPLDLRRTGMPQGTLLPDPFIHGYLWEEGVPQDYSQFFPPLDSGIAWGGWGWASGGLVSTPADLNRFVRGYAGGELFGPEVQEEQAQFLDGGQSDPPGPGENAAGLAMFRYETRCGTVLGHTGSIPAGYTQFAASTRNGKRSVSFTITIQFTEEILPALRRAEVRAVCAALARR
jgi:D-alanyl-D-alanine carboxypeptidase